MNSNKYGELSQEIFSKKINNVVSALGERVLENSNTVQDGNILDLVPEVVNRRTRRAYTFKVHKAKYSKIDLPIPADFIRNPKSRISKWRKSIIDTFNALLSLDVYFNGNVYISQGKLAHMIGKRDRDTAGDACRFLASIGFISMLNRGKTSCRYKISSFFRSKIIKSMLCVFFPALTLLSPTMDYSSYGFSTEKTRTIKKEDIIIKKLGNRKQYKERDLDSYKYFTDDERRVKEKQQLFQERLNRIAGQKKEKQLTLEEKIKRNKQMAIDLLVQEGVKEHKLLPFYRVPKEIINNIRSRIGSEETSVSDQICTVKDSQDILKKDKGKLVQSDATLSTCVTRPAGLRPTIKDIPQEKMKQIEKLPENMQQKVIQNVLRGLILKWENQNG